MQRNYYTHFLKNQISCHATAPGSSQYGSVKRLTPGISSAPRSGRQHLARGRQELCDWHPGCVVKKELRPERAAGRARNYGYNATAISCGPFRAQWYLLSDPRVPVAKLLATLGYMLSATSWRTAFAACQIIGFGASRRLTEPYWDKPQYGSVRRLKLRMQLLGAWHLREWSWRRFQVEFRAKGSLLYQPGSTAQEL